MRYFVSPEYLKLEFDVQAESQEVTYNALIVSLLVSPSRIVAYYNQTTVFCTLSQEEEAPAVALPAIEISSIHPQSLTSTEPEDDSEDPTEAENRPLTGEELMRDLKGMDCATQIFLLAIRLIKISKGW